ncbi:MAG TPA: GNAT family N-acetyltransferase [Thermoanaerobaculia bacterium]|jgi:RimJ/RimL family protein N-acetyltransferase|nr:GNAT family N-acetyltransferase [Thermoanaerobaculia bacterium]
MQSPSIHTARLELRAGHREIYRIPFDDRDALALAMRVNVPENWPVEHYDADPLVWSVKKLDEDPSAAPWLLRYFIERETNTLVGFGGGGGLPAEGTWTIGYSVLPQFRRRGYASEALAALVAEAFRQAEVERIIGETYPELVASIGVLEKNGFVFVGPGDGERVIRYERKRRTG